MKTMFTYIEGRERQEDWKRSIESFLETMTPAILSNLEFISLIKGTESVENFIFLCQAFYRYKKGNPDEESVYNLFASHVDGSPHSIDDWALSLSDFQKWLDDNQRTSDLKTMLGYLICCAASPESKETKESLRALFYQMISVHGFDSAKKKL